MKKTVPFSLPLVCGLIATALLGCGGKGDAAAPAAAASAPAVAASGAGPAVTVSTVRALKRDMRVLLEAAGTVSPLTSVDVRSQVTNIISKVHIKDGQFVKAGELLFTLDARTDEANVAKAQAQLAKDNAALADAQRQWVRAQQLLAQNFISQGAVDTSKAQVDSQLAAVAADQAAIDAARVALSYARIVAPNAGRAGIVAVSAGNAVQANVTPLVTITQLDPIAVAFSIPQRNLSDALAALKDGGAEVTAALGEKAERFTGHLKFVDNAVYANSGSVKVKAVFANPGGKLWPGAFVQVSQTVSTLKDAVVIPQACVIQSARGAIVYVVQDGKAILKPVQVLYAQGEDAAISGVNAGETVVLVGKQNLRPGSSVVERAKGEGANAATSKQPAQP